MSAFLNFVLYQAGWFACVLGLAWDRQELGMGLALALTSVHLGLARDRSVQFRLCVAAAAVGLLADSLQMRAGVFVFPRGVWREGWPPPCMTVLWMQFATTFRYSMSWLGGRYLMAAVFGFCGAPLAYAAGEMLGAVAFLPPRWLHALMLGTVWSLTTPLLVFLGDWLGRRDGGPAGYRWPLQRFSAS